MKRLPTNSLGKYNEISLVNLYMDIGALRVMCSFIRQCINSVPHVRFEEDSNHQQEGERK